MSDNRLVFVTAVNGERFVGWVPDDVENPRTYMEGYRVKLCNVRTLIIQITPNMQKQAALIPVDLVPKAVPEYYIVPSSWYFPADWPQAMEAAQALLKTADENEMRIAAASAGIVMPGRR